MNAKASQVNSKVPEGAEEGANIALNVIDEDNNKVSEDDLKVGYSWDVNIIASTEGAMRNPDSAEDTESYFYTYWLKALFAGDDLSKIDEVEIDTEESQTSLDRLIIDRVKDGINGLTSSIDWVKDFIHNPGGTLIRDFVLKPLKAILGDFPQWVANLIQTVPLGTWNDWTLDYWYSDLAADGSTGNRNMYTKVSEYDQRDSVSYEGQKHIYVNGTQYGFSRSTKIPVIPADIYNMAVGDIGFLDINFLTGHQRRNEDNSLYHAANSPWVFLRNFASAVIHVTIYLASAILLSTLIWHGIHIVRGSLDPREGVEHKEGLERFGTSLLILIGSIIIMALCIFASDMFLGDLKSNTYELPIRVNVELEDGKGYSFSTNFAGYLRYMSQIEDVDQVGTTAMYTIAYIIMAILNLVAVVGMSLRMLIMLLLAMVGPITAALHALHLNENGGVLSFKTWVELYVSFAVLQVFLAILSRIILECAIIE